MTNKQLYNLVFENFVQAKRELIREGYRKGNLDEVDFNEVFDKTKHKLAEEKIKSLQRENEMLKSKLSERRGLKEAGTMSAAGMGRQGDGAGSEGLWNALTNVFARVGVKTAMIDVVLDKLKAIDSQKTDKYSNIKNILTDSNDMSKFEIKLKKYLNSGNNLFASIRKALDELKTQSTLAESKRRRY